MVLFAVRMVADVTETRNVIPRIGFVTCMNVKVKVFTILFCFEFEFLVHALCRPKVNIHKIYVLHVIYTVVISSLRPVEIT